MKYFLIAGEASGDLHAANLIRELKVLDAEAQFRCYGGDLMQSAGAELLKHYRDLAFMGFGPVLRHLPQIMRGMRQCKAAIAEWQPDAVVLIDYPGFNLDIARYVRRRQLCPVYYYISPKIWAWKSYRLRRIRRDVNLMLSILPFEVDWYAQRRYHVEYVGNPTVDELAGFRESYRESFADFARRHGLDAGQPVIALLAGSRRQEVKDNLQRMCLAARPYADRGYQIVLAGARSLPVESYDQAIAQLPAEAARPVLVYDETYPLLAHATAALVTSGTAALETALLGVPQVVCYYTGPQWLAWLMRHVILSIKYVSLVNLTLNRMAVEELLAGDMTVEAACRELGDILPGGSRRQSVLEAYDELRRLMGQPGAPRCAAGHILAHLRALGED